MFDLKQIVESKELFDGHYKLLYPLNTDGATADIWLAVDTNTVDDDEYDNIDEEQGLKVAIKVYRPQNALDIEGVQKFRNEFKVVFNCQHSNLLHPVHFSIYKEMPYLVLPYCQNGSCELLIGQMMDNDAIWKFISDVASGLDYLHTNIPQIIHQDIKPANILIDDKQNYTITDFGISIANDFQKHNVEDKSGTLAYMAPERFVEDTLPLPGSDVWALGATLYELITGRVPFGEKGGSEMPCGKLKLTFPDEISKGIKNLIFACLDVNIANRPTAAQLFDAAVNKIYPPQRPNRTLLFMGVAGLCAIAVLLSCYFWLSSKYLVEEQTNIPTEEKAMVQELELDRNNIEMSTPAQEKDMPLEVQKEIRYDGSAYVTKIFNKTTNKLSVILNGYGKRYKVELNPGEISTPNFICTSIFYRSKQEEGVFWKKERKKDSKTSSINGVPVEIQKEVRPNGKAFVSCISNYSERPIAVRIFTEEKSLLYYLAPSEMVKPYRLCDRIAYGDKDGWHILWTMQR